MRGQLRIEQMYAFVMVDPRDNTEGIPAYIGPSGMPTPMVGADMKRVERLRPIAEDVARIHQAKITLCRFEARTEVEVFDGTDQTPGDTGRTSESFEDFYGGTDG